jgi:acetyltransferase-like isoleucine patch superfamily enzyme
MSMFIKRLTRRIMGKLGVLMYEAGNDIARATLPAFGNNPKNLKIDLPRVICHPELIFIGDDVSLGLGTFLIAQTGHPAFASPAAQIQQFPRSSKSRITIGNRVTATANLQIAAMSEIVIEDDVLLASNINITDGLHGYENAYEPYATQAMFRIAPIRIKRGCWIGQNVVVLPGVTIGEMSIVGANSVVTRSLPARCIAVGCPASVIKNWDNNTGRWVPARDGVAEETGK